MYVYNIFIIIFKMYILVVLCDYDNKYNEMVEW